MVSNIAVNRQIYESTDDTFFRKQPRSSSENASLFVIDSSECVDARSNTRQGTSSPTIGTNNFAKQRIPLWLEKNLLDAIALNDEERRKKLIDSAVSKLTRYLKFYNYDEDSEDYIWPVVDDIATSSISILGAAFQRIVIQRNDCINILCAIAKCLCSFDLEQTAEWGPMILVSLLSHKNETVKEYAVFLLENWRDQSLLPLLKNLDCRSSWLRAYIDSVVFDLEG